MPNEVDARRKFLKAQLGAGAPNNIAELEALYASKLRAGTQAGAPLATTTVAGAVKKSASVNLAAGANPTKAEFDALINALKAAGIMA